MHLFVLFLVSLAIAAENDAQTGTIFFSDNQFHFQPVYNTNGVAYGSFSDEMEQTGWGKLTIKTNPVYSNDNQSYAAGMLEGILTQKRIFQMYTNLYHDFSASTQLSHFIDENIKYMESFSDRKDEYGQSVYLAYMQLRGLMDGYNIDPPSHLDLSQILYLSSTGDLLDLKNAFKEPSMTVDDFLASPQSHIYRTKYASGHCSGLVKMTANMSEIFVGHTSWFEYASMLRIWKDYSFGFRFSKKAAPGYRVVFSSYPGFLVSLDDFYITSAGLWVSETTNNIFDHSLYKALTPKSLLYWVRIKVANLLSDSSSKWTTYFGVGNSGTYNSQFIVFDQNKFQPGLRLDPKAVLIFEQIPGDYRINDVTPFVRYGYWPSYNVPYDPYIFNVSGYPAMAEKYPEMFSYHHCSRANIFRRDAEKVESLEHMKKIMRYNDWQNDPLSHKNPGYAISSRFDLNPNPAERMAAGGYDSKVSSTKMISDLSAVIQSGPTHDQQPVFIWSAFPKVSHVGQPEAFGFDWETV